MKLVNFISETIKISDLQCLSSFATISAERRNVMEDILIYLKKYWKEIIVGIFICISITLSCYSIFYKSSDEDKMMVAKEDKTIVNEEEEVLEEPTYFYVDVKGAVVTPGVYKIEGGAIIQDVINLAGGFLADAYQDGINLSQKVSDGMVVYVYTTKEVEKNSKTTSSGNNTSTNGGASYDASYNIQDWVLKKESVIANDVNISSDGNSGNNSVAEENKIININTANQSELTTLSGIGDAKAQAIIDYRNTNGYFKSIEDIKNVSGIGDVIFAKIKDYITI